MILERDQIDQITLNKEPLKLWFVSRSIIPVREHQLIRRSSSIGMNLITAMAYAACEKNKSLDQFEESLKDGEPFQFQAYISGMDIREVIQLNAGWRNLRSKFDGGTFEHYYTLGREAWYQA